jgi:hypothetical protein
MENESYISRYRSHFLPYPSLFSVANVRISHPFEVVCSLIDIIPQIIVYVTMLALTLFLSYIIAAIFILRYIEGSWRFPPLGPIGRFCDNIGYAIRCLFDSCCRRRDHYVSIGQPPTAVEASREVFNIVYAFSQ